MSTTTTTETPAIYVASLSDYNAGTLHGCWIKIDEDTTLDDVEIAIKEMLTDSREALAEEWEIHDVDCWPRGIGGRVARLDLEKVVQAAHLIGKHGEAIAHHFDYVGEWDEESFADNYQGCWPSERAFVKDSCDRDMDEVPDWLLGHIDWESLTRSWFCERYYSSSGAEGMHVFWRS